MTRGNVFPLLPSGTPCRPMNCTPIARRNDLARVQPPSPSSPPSIAVGRRCLRPLGPLVRPAGSGLLVRWRELSDPRGTQGRRGRRSGEVQPLVRRGASLCQRTASHTRFVRTVCKERPPARLRVSSIRGAWPSTLRGPPRMASQLTGSVPTRGAPGTTGDCYRA